MKFNSKKEEFIYYSNRCKEAKEKKDKTAYLLFLAKSKQLLEEIEQEKNTKK